MKNKGNTLHLPEDLLLEILSRVSVASLARLQFTSKGWNNLIKYVILPKKSIMLIDFRVCLVSVDLHGTNNDGKVVKITSQFSLKDPKSKEEVYIINVFHCEGLLLCITKHNKLVVWNPCSGETSWIKERYSNKNLVYYALGKSCGNEYKILKVTQGRGLSNPGPVEYEVYDFTSKSWRSVGETRDWSIPEASSQGTTMNGNTYWLAVSQVSSKRTKILLRFDFSTEIFKVLSIPDDHLSFCFRYLSVTGDQKQQLCMLATYPLKGFKTDVWLATETNSAVATSWRNFKSVEVVDPADLRPCFMLSSVMNFLIDRDDKVLVYCGGRHFKVILLELLGEDKSMIVDRKVGSRCSHLLSYALPTSARIK